MPEIIRKALAAVTPVEDSAEYPNGAFDLILSAQTEDRDGDTLKSDEWKMPLPDHITMDSDHGMSVATTVGSGEPFINDDGDLQVRGTFASTAHAQNTRTLVNEKHIRTASVAFVTTRKATKSQKSERELLNGAFVAIPSNREALVLSSKSMSAAEPADGIAAPAVDQVARHDDMVQAIHDASSHLGADCASQNDATGENDGANKSFTVVAKGISGSVEDMREQVSNALRKTTGPDQYAYVRATFLESDSAGMVVYDLESTGGESTLSRSFTVDNGVVTLGDEVTEVALVTSVAPVNKTSDESQAMTKDAAAQQFAVLLKSLEDSSGSAGSPHDSASKSAATAAPSGTAAATEATAEDVALRAQKLAFQLGAQAH